ncbi:fatty acid desaturase [Phlyctema vagabunda]|uniref:Fatty acid desaturase n=1 Tax=Phlyctema vagabunda TaxID=108571 RepID=A0ABR4P6W5_9HELO
MLRAVTPPIKVAPTPPVKEAPLFTPPEYTMKDIHDAIPSHCFDRSTLVSLLYVLRDMFFVVSLMCIAATQIPKLENSTFRTLGWLAYSFCQGLIFTGMWEIAHECGHGALSKRKWFNNSVGLLLHSFLLVPYHSWRFTHSSHHKATNNLERDIAFVPDSKENYLAKRESRGSLKWGDLVEDMPIVAFIWLCVHQIVAFPIYLTVNNFALPWISAASWYKRSHFYFASDGPLFKSANRNDIILSDLGIGTMAFALWVATHFFGGWNVMLFYGFPYMWTNHWILTITFLQHTDGSIPYYPSSTWSFLRGAASTVDRDFGFIGRVLFHGAIETHVLHHHASRIPFYHAAEASRAIRTVMGVHYQSDFKTPYLWAFWKNYRACRYIEEIDVGSEIFFFSKNE